MVYRYYEEQLGKQVRVPCKFINYCWYQIYWTHNEYCLYEEMKFSKYDYELNQIDLPKSMRESPEPSEGSAEPEEQPTMYEEVKIDTSVSNQSRGSPPTQMNVEPIERALTTPIDEQLLRLTITEPPMEEAAPAVQVDTPTGPLVIPPVYRPVFNWSATVTTQIATSTAGPSRTGGGSGSGGGGGGGEGGGGGGGGGGRGGGGATGQATGQAPFSWNGLQGVPLQLFKGDRELFFFFFESAFIKRSVHTNYKDVLGPTPLARGTNTRKKGPGWQGEHECP